MNCGVSTDAVGQRQQPGPCPRRAVGRRRDVDLEARRRRDEGPRSRLRPARSGRRRRVDGRPTGSASRRRRGAAAGSRSRAPDRCARPRSVAMRPCGVRSMNPRRSRNGSWTSSIVSTSSDRTAASAATPTGPGGELLDDRGQQLAVRRIEALVVDLHRAASPSRAVASSTRPSPWTCGVVADALEQPVDDARRASAAPGDRPGRGRVDRHVEDLGRALDDLGRARRRCRSRAGRSRRSGHATGS